MAWLYLTLAGLFEIAWALGLKKTEGFTKLWPSVYTLATMAVSIYLLSIAVARLPVGTAYAVWTGIGAAGTAILGMVLFGESRDWPRMVCIGLILCGVVGLKVISPPRHEGTGDSRHGGTEARRHEGLRNSHEATEPRSHEG